MQRLIHVIQLWCSEFDRTDDSDGRREPLTMKDITQKRRGDRRGRDDKARVANLFYMHQFILFLDLGDGHEPEGRGS